MSYSQSDMYLWGVMTPFGFVDGRGSQKDMEDWERMCNEFYARKRKEETRADGSQQDSTGE